MQRVTMTLDDELMEAIDRLVIERGYQNRSEAVRDLARAGLKASAEETGEGKDCVAALVYVYDHEARQLSKRLTNTFHDHHDLSLATMHVHLDHDSCMEVTVLRGAAHDVRHLADHVIAERGVRHGRLVTVPVSIADERHDHGHGHDHEHGGHGHAHPHRHSHTHVRDGD